MKRKNNLPGFGAFNQPWRLSGTQRGGNRSVRKKKMFPEISPIMAADMMMSAKLQKKTKSVSKRGVSM